MYDARADPYCYPGTGVLKNIPGIREPEELELFEQIMTGLRYEEPLPGGRFSIAHYRSVHRHLFQDIYAWAGKIRTVRLAKGASAFCYPENIDRELKSLFQSLRAKRALTGLERAEFVTEAASFLATLNAVHPFREGNGRAQIAFLMVLAAHAGHPIDIGRLRPKPFLSAMVASFKGDERALVRQIARLID